MNTNESTQKKNQPSQPPPQLSFEQPGPSHPSSSSSAAFNRLTSPDVPRNVSPAIASRNRPLSSLSPSASAGIRPKATFTLPVSTTTSANAKPNSVITSFTSAVIATSTAHNWAHSQRSHSIYSIDSDQQPIRIAELSVYADRLDYEYQPGDCVSGKLRLVLESGQLCVRRLLVTLRGIASVRFTEREYKSSSQNERHFEDVNYWADQSILEYTCHPRLHDIKVLTPGEYHLPFKFNLPKCPMPNSFESYYGHIRYWISGEVRPKHKARTANDLYEKLTDDFEVSIISPPNVPIAEQLRSVNAENVKEMGCCSCLSRSPGFIHVRANIARQLQLRGTCVQVNLFVVNRSAKQITPNVTLKQRQEFRAPTKCKVVENELLACNGNVVQPGDSVLQSILLPLSLDLPLVHNCPIISISYRIKIGIEIPRAFDMYFHLPILLTQHPLQSLTLTVARNSSPTNLVDDPLGSANRQSPIIDLHPPLPPSSPSSSLPHPNNPLPFALVPTQSDSVAKPLSKK